MWSSLEVCRSISVSFPSNGRYSTTDEELVIGGPTGLLTGLLLHRLGVCVSILGTVALGKNWRMNEPKANLGQNADLKTPNPKV